MNNRFEANPAVPGMHEAFPTRHDYRRIFHGLKASTPNNPVLAQWEPLYANFLCFTRTLSGEQRRIYEDFMGHRNLATLIANIDSQNAGVDKPYQRKDLPAELFEELNSIMQKRWIRNNEVFYSPQQTNYLYTTLETAGDITPHTQRPDSLLFRFNDDGTMDLEAHEYTLADLKLKSGQLEYLTSGQVFNDLFFNRSGEWKRFLADDLRSHDPHTPAVLPANPSTRACIIVPTDYPYDVSKKWQPFVYDSPISRYSLGTMASIMRRRARNGSLREAS